MLFDEVVIIKQAEKHDEATVITINCPDKTGLGCDLCRTILFFGLSIVRGGMLLVFFVFLWFSFDQLCENSMEIGLEILCEGVYSVGSVKTELNR